MIKLNIVVAYAENMIIGNDGRLPWNNLKYDMGFFRLLTTYGEKGVEHFFNDQNTYESVELNSRFQELNNNAVIMGRKTWDSISDKFRPLPNRTNIVLTRKPENVFNAITIKNVSQLSWIKNNYDINEIFVIGGAQIYDLLIKTYRQFIGNVYVTHVRGKFIGDCVFPTIPMIVVKKGITINDNGLMYQFIKYKVV